MSDFGEMSIQERHERLWEELSVARRTVANLQDTILDLTGVVARMTTDFDLIRRYSGENIAGLPLPTRNKYLIVIIPTIVDHALNDMISGGEEAYALIAK
jgi:hypothetical protein